MKIDSDKVFRLARKHLGDNSSARACMADAMRQQSEGNLDLAIKWALRSLAHSIGICSPDYALAFKASGVDGEIKLVSVWP